MSQISLLATKEVVWIMASVGRPGLYFYGHDGVVDFR